MAEIPADLLALIRATVSRRARIVIDHIVEQGAITTEELEQQYGYRLRRVPHAMCERRESPWKRSM